MKKAKKITAILLTSVRYCSGSDEFMAVVGANLFMG
jgi:hypothetical protein